MTKSTEASVGVFGYVALLILGIVLIPTFPAWMTVVTLLMIPVAAVWLLVAAWRLLTKKV